MRNTYKSSKEAHNVALVLPVRLHRITDVDLRLGGGGSHHQWLSKEQGSRDVGCNHNSWTIRYAGWCEV